MFGSRQQQQPPQQPPQQQQQSLPKKRGKFLRGHNNHGKLFRSGNVAASTSNTKGFRRLSPLKENSPSRPKLEQPTLLDHSTTFVNENTRNYKSDNIKNNITYTKLSATTQPSPPPPGFSQAEIQDLHESFKLFDIENTGSIQVGDLTAILQTLKSEQEQQQQQEQEGTPPPQQQQQYPHLDKLLRRLSTFGEDELLTLDDYMNLMASTTISNAMAESESEAEYYQDHNNETYNYVHVFRLFDMEGKGYIDLNDLERVALELGEHDMTQEELLEMLERAANNQGRVGLEEFTRMMTTNLFPKTTTTVAAGAEQQQQQQS
ncbi:EF hand domain containing protein [Nitzschia inconspicua]|uniref:Calmodulin n=1 Tax=Nitzschia inconspicua TaxID=303405 RepID=A0A9K3KY46_9STRA|nr:EF hand domain containing protein [Nitzschia inconspicua]